MTELQQRVSRRLALLGPGPAAFFRDVCRLVDEVHSGRWPLETASHIVGHLLREFEGSVRHVLYTQLVESPTAASLAPVDALDPGRDVPRDGDDGRAQGLSVSDDAGERGDECESNAGAKQREQVTAILRALQFPEESAELALWRALGRGAVALHKLAHRDALTQPRPLTADLVARVHAITTMIDSVLDRFEARYASVYDQLDLLLAKDAPTRADVRLLKNAIPNTPRTLRYFFEKLLHPNWLDPLARAGYFDSPPPPDIDDSRNTIGFPPWMVVDFLQRMAPLRAERVAQLVASIPDTKNVRVHAQLIGVLLALRPEDRRRLASRVEEWVEGLARYHFGTQPPRLAIAYVHDGYLDSALSLTERVLGLPTAWRSISTPFRPRFSDNHQRAWHLRDAAQELFPALFQHAPAAATELIAGALDFYAGRRTQDADAAPGVEAGLADYSTLWTEDLGDRERIDASDHRAFLVHVLRSGIVQVGTATPAFVPDLLGILRLFGARVLRRIDLAVLGDLLRSDATDVRDSILPIAITRLKAAELLAQEELDGEMSALLRVTIPLANPVDQQGILDSLSPPDFSWMQEQDFAARRRAKWRRDRLSLVAEHLPPRERGELTALIEAEGAPEPLAIPRFQVTSSDGPPSPLDEIKIRSMDVEELLGFLAAWQPRSDLLDAPTRSGLARQLRAVVAESPDIYAARAKGFIGQHPIYVQAILDGLRTALRGDRIFDWTEVLLLAEWTTEQAVPENDTDEAQAVGDGTILREARRILADTLGVALTRTLDVRGALPFEEHDRIWRILELLAEDANPTPMYEHEAGGDDIDASVLALNTVRPEAIDAAIQFAVWSAQHASQNNAGIRDLLTREPAVAALLERHLDPSQDSSRAVRAAIGRWLTPLARTDPEWVRSHLPSLLPAAPEYQALRSALWDAFTRWSRPHPDALVVLEPAYQASIETLAVTDQTSELGGSRGERSQDRLAEHLVTLYWWGAIALNATGNLIQTFFARGDVAARAHALQHVGYSLLHTSGTVDSAVVSRLRHLWDWRAVMLFEAIAAVGQGASLVDHPSQMQSIADEARKELVVFGWWFSSGVFEPEWALRRLEEVLKVCGNVDAAHSVTSELELLADRHPALVMSCLLAVDFSGDGEPWTVHSWIEHLPTIVRTALASSDLVAVNAATEVVNRVVAAGYTEHRSLLQQGGGEQ